MERRLDQDFSGVRVHTDAAAVKSADAMHARAYTIGQGTSSLRRGRLHRIAPKAEAADRARTHACGPERRTPLERRSIQAGERAGRRFRARGSQRRPQRDGRPSGSHPGGAFRGGSARTERCGNRLRHTVPQSSEAPLVGLGIAAVAGAFGQEEAKGVAGSLLDDPGFRRKWEAGLEEGLKKLESAQPEGLQFPGRSGARLRPGELDGNRRDKQQELSVQYRGLVQGRRASFSRLDRWTCDCRLFGEIAPAACMVERPQGRQSAVQQGGSQGSPCARRTTTGISRKTVQPEEVAEFDDATWESAPVGSKVVWKREPVCAGALVIRTRHQALDGDPRTGSRLRGAGHRHRRTGAGWNRERGIHPQGSEIDRKPDQIGSRQALLWRLPTSSKSPMRASKSFRMTA